MIKRYFFGLFFLTLLNLNLEAQECSNCTAPKLILFGLDIPEPDHTDSTQSLWRERMSLFAVSQLISGAIMRSEGECMRYTITPSVDEGDKQTMKVGNMSNTTASNAKILADLSEYGDYYLSGDINRSGETYTVSLQVRAACSKDIVASGQTNFTKADLYGSLIALANTAVAQILPLHLKIIEFEEKQREKTSRAILGMGGEVKVLPNKRVLMPGEQCDIQLLAVDCDGKALKNRTLLFGENTFSGSDINGTSGGVITPESVITDENGKAKVHFRMTAKSASIEAYSIKNNVRGCRDIVFGSAIIGPTHFKVSMVYDRYSRDTSDVQWTGGQIAGLDLQEQRADDRYFNSTFYYYPKNKEDTTTISVSQRNESGARTVFERKTSGAEQSFFQQVSGEVWNSKDIVLPTGFKVGTLMDTTKQQFYKMTHDFQPEIEILMGPAKDQFQVSFNLNVPGLFTGKEATDRYQDRGPHVWNGFPDVQISNFQKEARLERKAIKDPESPYRTEYTIYYYKDLGTDLGPLLHQSGSEKVKVKILSPYEW